MAFVSFLKTTTGFGIGKTKSLAMRSCVVKWRRPRRRGLGICSGFWRPMRRRGSFRRPLGLRRRNRHALGPSRSHNRPSRIARRIPKRAKNSVAIGFYVQFDDWNHRLANGHVPRPDSFSRTYASKRIEERKKTQRPAKVYPSFLKKKKNMPPVGDR